MGGASLFWGSPCGVLLCGGGLGPKLGHLQGEPVNMTLKRAAGHRPHSRPGLRGLAGRWTRDGASGLVPRVDLHLPRSLARWPGSARMAGKRKPACVVTMKIRRVHREVFWVGTRGGRAIQLALSCRAVRAGPRAWRPQCLPDVQVLG